MEVFKRKDNRSPFWFADMVDPRNGQRVRPSLRVRGSKAEAEKVAQRMWNEWDQERLANKGERPSVTLAYALGAYAGWLLAHKRAAAQGIERLTQKTLGRMGVHPGLPPATPLHTLTPAMVEGLVMQRMRAGNSAQTIAHEVKAIRAATRHASGLGFRVPTDMLNGSIRDAWRMPKLTQKTRYLSVEEFQAVFTHLNPDRLITQTRGSVTSTASPGGVSRAQRQDVQDLFLALGMCGGRWSEVSGLTWDRVDTEALGESDRPVLIRLWGNKTKAERVMVASDQMRAMLRRRMSDAPSGCPLIFPGRGGAQRVGTCRAIIRAMDACGLNTPRSVAESGRATVHSLRHTFASLLVQNGANLAEVQDALGHTSLAMTRRYAHLSKADGAARLAGVLTRALPLTAH